MNEPARITRKTLAQGLDVLAGRDGDLARVIAQVGTPPLRARPAGFATLLKIICAQQVSGASARAITRRLEAAAHPLTPESFLALGERALRTVGFSRQKVVYGRALAEAIAGGALSLGVVARADDAAAIAALSAIKGIGRWSAEMYLLFALRRPDIWPVGDLAVVTGLARAKGLTARPGAEEMARLGEAYRPWRSVAARLMWHYYGSAPDDTT